jgi:hypothetical protein
VGDVEGEECGVVVCSRERELISRSNKKNPLWRIYERPIGSEQQHDVLATTDYLAARTLGDFEKKAWRCNASVQTVASLPAA